MNKSTNQFTTLNILTAKALIYAYKEQSERLFISPIKLIPNKLFNILSDFYTIENLKVSIISSREIYVYGISEKKVIRHEISDVLREFSEKVY